MHQPTPTPTAARTCAHLFPATPTQPPRRCGSPALRYEQFCYYHHPTRRPVSYSTRFARHDNIAARAARAAANRARRLERQAFDLTLPTTRAEINHTLGQLLTRIAANTIDTRRAGQLLSALQIAARTLPAATPSPAANTSGHHPRPSATLIASCISATLHQPSPSPSSFRSPPRPPNSPPPQRPNPPTP